MNKALGPEGQTLKLTSEQLGDAGEDLFRSLATLGQLIANPSDRDKKGWDFFVQPNRPTAQACESLDQRSEWSCHVQLKTTAERKAKSVQVKLSTLESFAKLSGPSLLIVFRTHPDGRPKRGYIIPIIGEQLRRVLLRLRRAQAKGDYDLAKETLSFDYKSKGQAFELTPNGLREAVETSLGGDYGEYVVEKQRQLRELGYEEAELVGQVAFRVEREDQLARMWLGLDPIKTSGIRVFDARFGILIPYCGSLFSDLEDVYVTPPSVGVWRVAMKGTNALEEAAVFDVELHVAPPTLGAPHSLLKHDDFTIIFDDEGLKFETQNVYAGSKRTLDGWCRLMRGLAHLAGGRGTLSIMPGSGEVHQFPVTDRLSGPNVDDLPKLRDFLEGWQKLVGLAGTTASAPFTIDEAKASLDAQMAVGLLLDPNPPGYLEFDIEGQEEQDQLTTLYFNGCAFAGAEISFCARVFLKRMVAGGSTFRSRGFELVDIRPKVCDLKEYGRDRAEAEGITIVLDPEFIERV